ncbi:MAG: type II toxin-antitoxin system HicB family antitoxin [Opitutales bacterium]
MNLRAVIHHDADGLWAEVPALPGCFTQADTMEELEANLREAIEAWLMAGNANEPTEPGSVFEVAL